VYQQFFKGFFRKIVFFVKVEMFQFLFSFQINTNLILTIS
jgi:hypothetical protein